ncbi:MAG: flagellar biosynthetic protein FliQ [Novosphingobium sp.]|uniref:flagellar biosynthetic protein FliQ n=1 Tax=Novosphingobium sp. TaxID=1874826 RepID=UPI0032B79BA5
MTGDQALTLLDRMLWTAALVSAPILLSILLIGVIISVIQVATQIQEMTLTYVPKLLASAFLLIVLGSWMLGKLTGFARELLLAIPDLTR